VIRLQEFQKQLADVKEKIYQKVSHPYLMRYIESPDIDEDKILLLLSILKELNLSEEEISNYAITIMLIQIALDTHEHVSNANLEEGSLKTRQLTVLAGDYYSGLYYKILADMKDIHMIQILAEGIKDVNEHKISVYQKESDDLETLMASIKMIEGSLYSKLSSYFQVSGWYEFVSNLLFVKRLISEREKFVSGSPSIVFDGLEKLARSVTHKNSIEKQRYLLALCDRYIMNSKLLLEKAMTNIPFFNELINQRMLSIFKQHQPLPTIFVEEG
jgi:heptaprenyl diphosphate synthase